MIENWNCLNLSSRFTAPNHKDYIIIALFIGTIFHLRISLFPGIMGIEVIGIDYEFQHRALVFFIGFRLNFQTRSNLVGYRGFDGCWFTPLEKLPPSRFITYILLLGLRFTVYLSIKDISYILFVSFLTSALLFTDYVVNCKEGSNL